MQGDDSEHSWLNQARIEGSAESARDGGPRARGQYPSRSGTLYGEPFRFMEMSVEARQSRMSCASDSALGPDATHGRPTAIRS